MTSNGPSPSPDPSLIMDLAVAYRGAMMLFAANELDLFTTLSKGPQTAAQLAEVNGAERRPLEALLNGCVALGLPRGRMSFLTIRHRSAYTYFDCADPDSRVDRPVSVAAKKTRGKHKLRIDDIDAPPL